MKISFDENEWPNKWRLNKRTINGMSRNYKVAIKKAATDTASEGAQNSREGHNTVQIS